MKNHRINTTISSKHWGILKKHADKYKTQQKVLEAALENLDDDSKQTPQLSIEDEIWLQAGREVKNALLLFQKECGKLFIETADMERFKEYVTEQRPVEFALEYYYKKPIKACTLKEIIDGVILNIKMMGGAADSLKYADDGDYYTINMMHTLGINFSKIMIIMHESMFKNYGVKTESHFSERSVFFKIYKNSQ